MTDSELATAAPPADAAPCDVRDGWCVTHNTASEPETVADYNGVL